MIVNKDSGPRRKKLPLSHGLAIGWDASVFAKTGKRLKSGLYKIILPVGKVQM